jgi:hypothetical protein
MTTATDRRWFEAGAGIGYCVLCGRHGAQVSHSNMLRGLRQKSAAWNTAALCPECHHDIDNAPRLDQAERRALHFRAITMTHDALIRSGRLVLR